MAEASVSSSFIGSGYSEGNIGRDPVGNGLFVEVPVPITEDGVVFPSPLSEDSSLLGHSTSPIGSVKRRRQKRNQDRYLKLLRRIGGYSLSAFINIALTYSLDILPLARVGVVLGTDALSSASVGLFSLYIFGQYPIIGFALALDTLCAQEFGRCHRSRVLGLLLRRALLYGTVIIIPMSLILYVAVPWGLRFFFAEDVVADVQRLMLPAPLYLVLFNMFTCLQKFCFNQLHLLSPMIAVGVGALIVTPVTSYLLVPYGLTATMMGISLAWGVQCVVLTLLILRDPHLRHTLWLECPWFKGSAVGFPLPPREGSLTDEEDDDRGSELDVVHHGVYKTISSTERRSEVCDDGDLEEEEDRSGGLYVVDPLGIKEYVLLAFPSMVLVAGEASVFDLTILMAAALGSGAGASWSALLNYMLWYVAVSGGVSAAANALVGSALGRGDYKLARTYVRLVVAISIVVGIVDSLLILLTFDRVLVGFGLSSHADDTDSHGGPALEEQVSHLLRYLIPIYHIGESVQYALQGVFSGLGKSKLGATLLMGTLWLIGLPLSMWLGFYVVPDLSMQYRDGPLCLHDPDNPHTVCPKDVGIVGIVMGLIIAMAVECPLLLFALSKVNWRKAAQRASFQTLK